MATAQPIPGTASGTELVPLEQPILEMQLGAKTGSYVVALPNQEALVTSFGDHSFLRLSSKGSKAGKDIKDKKTFDLITALIVQGEEVLLLSLDGRICRRPMAGGEATGCWQVDAKTMSHGAALGRQLLVCLDRMPNKVFTISLQPDGSVHKRVKLEGRSLIHARVACTGVDDGLRIALAEPRMSRVEVYDAQWQLKTTIRGPGGGFDPHDCIFLPWGNLLVVDTEYDRVSEYQRAGSSKGQLVRHWLTADQNVLKPEAVSFLYPNLWVLNKIKDQKHGCNYVSRFKIFK